MLKKTLLTPKIIKNLKSNNNKFGWSSNKDQGIVLENKNLGIQIYYYGLFNEKGDFSYDTIGINERKGNSVVVIIDQNKNLGLLKEYRPIPDKEFISCVRGFSNEGENAIKTAIRELQEEVGDLEIVSNISLGEVYHNTTFFQTPVQVFLVNVISRRTKLSVNNHEMILNFHFYKPNEVLNLINSNKIKCQITLSALMLYFSSNILKINIK